MPEPAKYTENVHSLKLKETLEQSNAVLRNFLFLVNNLTSPAMISDNSYTGEIKRFLPVFNAIKQQKCW